MSIEEIKEEINVLTNDVTNDNVQGIVSTLNGIVGFILEKFKTPMLAEKFGQFPRKVMEKINTFEESYQFVASEVKSNNDLRTRKEEIEMKYTQLSLEFEKLKELKQKSEAIKELSQIQMKVEHLAKINMQEMEEQNNALKVINDVLAGANSDIERSFSENVSKLERNLSVLQNHQTDMLERLSKSSSERFGKEFLDTVNSLESDYNTYAELINSHKDKQAQIIKLYKQHHTENENICEALKRRIKDLKNLDTLNQEIKERLQHYDDEIKIVIENRDKMPIYQLEEASKY